MGNIPTVVFVGVLVVLVTAREKLRMLPSTGSFQFALFLASVEDRPAQAVYCTGSTATAKDEDERDEALEPTPTMTILVEVLPGQHSPYSTPRQ
jgi:hypothetical protein